MPCTISAASTIGGCNRWWILSQLLAVKGSASLVLCNAASTWGHPMMAATSASQAALRASSSEGEERVLPAWIACSEQKL